MPAPLKWSAADFELVNAENPEGHPWLSAAPDGRFSLMFFESLAGPPVHTDLEERIYSAAGASPASIGTTFSSTTVEKQPASAYMADGRRVLVWTEAPSLGGGNLEDVYAAVYYGNNIVAQPRFLVAGGAGTQLDPVVAASDNGFVVAVNDGSVAGGRLILKFYNIAGTVINTVTNADAPEGVNQQSIGEYRDVEITALANGNYVVTWSDHLQFDIFARVYSAGGIALSGILDVEPGGAQSTFPDVTALADGRFVVTYGQYGINTVRGHIYEADGTSSVSPFTIATNAINALQQQAQTAALHDGRFVTVWVRSTGNIEGQVMKADGTPDGAAFTVNGDVAGGKGRPTIATLADGRFVVSWESGAAAAKTIFSTIFDPREAGLFGAASSFDDDWHGTGFTDQIFGGPGADAIRGAGGVDYLYGEAGIDTLSGDAGDDRLIGGNDGDTLNGGADLDKLYGGLGNDTLNGDAGDDPYLDGGEGNDIIDGGAGNDSMIGGAGGDTINGGDNDDTAYGSAGRDTINGGLGIDRLFGGNEAGLGDTLSGDDGDDFLLGEQGDDIATGGIGNDRIDGGSGADILSGGAGGENISGAAGDDLIFGGSENDLLNGEADNDVIEGGAGPDVMFGGTGADVFAYALVADGHPNDQVSDWTGGSDKLRIDASAFGGGLAAGALAANRLVVGAAPVADQAFGQFLYNTVTGRLSWDADGTGAGAAASITRLYTGGLPVGSLAVADFDIVA